MKVDFLIIMGLATVALVLVAFFVIEMAILQHKIKKEEKLIKNGKL